MVMLITFFDRLARWLAAKNLNLLHKIGSYGLWFIFMISYFGRLAEARLVFLGPAVLILSMVVVRFLA